MSRRLARLNEQLKRELAEMIRLQVRDPRIGSVTITGVETAADLGSARVFVRSVGGREELASSLEGLNAAAPFLRSALGRTLRLRKVPELRFREDRSYEHARRIEALLSEVLPTEGDEERRAGSADPPPASPADGGPDAETAGPEPGDGEGGLQR